jgi:hypothetical protein
MLLREYPLVALHQFIQYCRDILGVNIHPAVWKESRTLPHFIRDAYDFHRIELFKVRILLAEDKRKEELPASALAKQVAQIKKHWHHEVVYIRPTITSYHRHRLIREGIPFVVPGNQMFLPMLGIDLRERFARAEIERPALSPSAQAVLLWILLGKLKGHLNPGTAADVLGYTPMTMTRVFSEFEIHGIGEQSKAKKNRQLVVRDNLKDLWDRSRVLLQSPVKKRVFVRAQASLRRFRIAGLSALAHYSMLAEPPVPVLACSANDWTAVERKLAVVPYADGGSVEIEIWKYRPDLLAENQFVDKLSLYLSLQEQSDERVAAARDEMIRTIAW